MWSSNSAGHWGLMNYRESVWVSNKQHRLAERLTEKTDEQQTEWGGDGGPSANPQPTGGLYMFMPFLWSLKDAIHSYITGNIWPYRYILPLSPIGILLTLAKSSHSLVMLMISFHSSSLKSVFPDDSWVSRVLRSGASCLLIDWYVFTVLSLASTCKAWGT